MVVQRQADGEPYSIHRLVHAWDRDRLRAEEAGRFCRAALDMLHRATQECGRAGDEAAVGAASESEFRRSGTT